jgi:hypothetical protein
MPRSLINATIQQLVAQGPHMSAHFPAAQRLVLRSADQVQQPS